MLYIAVAALLSSFVALGCGSSHEGPQRGPRKGYVAELIPVDPNDPIAVRKWAEHRCRGWTLNELARSLGVLPTKDAVTKRLARGFPPASRKIAIETCEVELAKTETAKHPDVER